jgi:predicted dehydrogenase
MPTSGDPGEGASQVPLRIGVLGLVHGHVHGFFRSALQRADVRVVGVCDGDAGVVARYRSQFALDEGILFSDAEAMLRTARPQVVVIYTSTDDHRAAVELCARHGVHAMMEKPLAVSVEDARAIEESARRSNIHVLVNYVTTWYRSHRAACALAHERALGDVRKIVFHHGHRGPRELGVQPEFLAWLTDPDRNGGGALFDFGCYGANLATWLLNGERPLSVMAVTQQIKPDVYPKVDDEATIVLTYPRAQAIIQASWNWPFSRKDMEIYGQTGYAIAANEADLRVRLGGGEEERIEAGPLPAAAADSLAYLRSVVSGAIPPEGPSSLENNLLVTEILDAARRSAASGAAVRLR